MSSSSVEPMLPWVMAGVMGVRAGEGGVAPNETPEPILRRPSGGPLRGGREGERVSLAFVSTASGIES